MPLLHGHFYHIYNRGINSCKLFREPTNYEHFLGLYDKYISPVADTYAWVLMGNHFHLLVRIKEENEIGIYQSLNTDRSNDSVRFQTIPNLPESEGPGKVKRPIVHKHFSHLFNAYTRYFNRKYSRTGKLVETPFSRIKVSSTNHLKYLIYYIHHNPIHHGFCNDMLEYPWSSYLTILSPKATHLKREDVLNWYSDTDSFRKFHGSQSIEKFKELQLDIPY